MKPILVTTTTSSAEEAKSIAANLVETKLAGCVNIMPITSVYAWQGKIQDEAEFKLFIKTSKEMWPKLLERIKELHSYSTPELTAIDILDMHPGYRVWLEECLKIN